MAGWQSERMVRRYAHLGGQHLAPHAEKMGAIWSQPVVQDTEKGNK